MIESSYYFKSTHNVVAVHGLYFDPEVSPGPSSAHTLSRVLRSPSLTAVQHQQPPGVSHASTVDLLEQQDPSHKRSEVASGVPFTRS